MVKKKASFNLQILNIDRHPQSSGVEQVFIQTDSGTINTFFHPVPHPDAAVIWVGGAGGGVNGPARGMYPRLAQELVPDQIASLRLDYRQPNHTTACVLDTLAGVACLKSLGFQRVVLVGHSFGGAVVITAGAQSAAVVAVATLSSQNAYTELASELAPRPLLLIHGTADRVLSPACSRDIYARAGQPRQLLLYEDCDHGLDECREQVDADLLAWIRDVLK